MNTIKMIVSLFTREGRQDVARMLIKPYLNSEIIAKEIAHGFTLLIDRGTNVLSDAKCETISKGCKLISLGVSAVGDTISPTSEEGANISDNERIMIESKIREGIDLVITAEMLNDLAECIIARIK